MDRFLITKRRCKCRTKLGWQCKNRTLKTKKCWICLAKENNLRIKPSTIPNSGLGLFTYKKPFKRFHKLGRYTGRVTTSDNLEKLYKGFMHANSYCKGTIAKERTPDDICIDANWSSDGPLHYANDIRSISKTNIGINDMAKNIKNKFIPVGYTLKCNRPNTELFNFYWKHYWQKHNVYIFFLL